ncbi:hypothetical protein [Methylobacterium sp. ID0610]|uniref:hypothetical protein n=1 Tax=Methylobacterium carpenticola TaxID=3344827 RepID=UPI0036A5B0FF
MKGFHDFPVINKDPEAIRKGNLRILREALDLQRERQGGDARLFAISPFIRYDEQGSIVATGEMAIGHIQALRIQGDRILPETGKWDTHYVDRGAEGGPRKRVKSRCPATLDGFTLRNAPQPCRVEISDPVNGLTVYAADDAEIELQFSHSGTYRVRVLSAPHTPGEWTIEVP